MTYPVTPDPAVHQTPPKYAVDPTASQQLQNDFAQLPQLIINQILNPILGALGLSSWEGSIDSDINDMFAGLQKIVTDIEQILVPFESIANLESPTAWQNAWNALLNLLGVSTPQLATGSAPAALPGVLQSTSVDALNTQSWLNWTGLFGQQQVTGVDMLGNTHVTGVTGPTVETDINNLFAPFASVNNLSSPTAWQESWNGLMGLLGIQTPDLSSATPTVQVPTNQVASLSSTLSTHGTDIQSIIDSIANALGIGGTNNAPSAIAQGLTAIPYANIVGAPSGGGGGGTSPSRPTSPQTTPYARAGTFQYTVPSWMTSGDSIAIVLLGGGGGGAGSGGLTAPGGNGSSWQSATFSIGVNSLVAGTVLTVYVGAGGAGGQAYASSQQAGDGQTGGNSQVTGPGLGPTSYGGQPGLWNGSGDAAGGAVDSEVTGTDQGSPTLTYQGVTYNGGAEQLNIGTNGNAPGGGGSGGSLGGYPGGAGADGQVWIVAIPG